jgi:quercetin dioxygenase-like cupin family protein
MKKLAGLLSMLIMLPASIHAQPGVESHGIASRVKVEEMVAGHLQELNGRFKLRATEVTFEPGGSLGAHHHAGPGIRYVASGEVTFVQAGKAIVYKAGEYFYESGDIVHTAQNRTKAPVRVIFFEILPAQLSGASVIAPKAH